MLAGALVAVVGSLAAYGTRRWLLHDSSRPVSVAEIVERYQVDEATTAEELTTLPGQSSPPPSSTTAPMSNSTPPGRAELPAPGVYVYTTSGTEHIDVLGGATHDYPATTTITVTSDPCGVQLRWDVLAERWDSWHLCATPTGITLDPSGTQYHEFFKQASREEAVCTSSLTLETGVSATTPCLLDGDPWAPSWTVASAGTRTIGGRQVEALQVTMTIAEPSSEQTTTEWVLTTGGLPLAATSTKHSVSSSPIGMVTYDEHYELSLTSLNPLR